MMAGLKIACGLKLRVAVIACVVVRTVLDLELLFGVGCGHCNCLAKNSTTIPTTIRGPHSSGYFFVYFDHVAWRQTLKREKMAQVLHFFPVQILIW